MQKEMYLTERQVLTLLGIRKMPVKEVKPHFPPATRPKYFRAAEDQQKW